MLIDADTVADENLTGAVDPIMVAAALREGRILLTLDKGITNLVQHPTHTHAGVVLSRPGASGRVTVVSERRIRVR